MDQRMQVMKGLIRLAPRHELAQVLDGAAAARDCIRSLRQSLINAAEAMLFAWLAEKLARCIQIGRRRHQRLREFMRQ